MANKQQAVEAIYPLSPLQKGMLYHILNEPEQRMYFEHWHCLLTGDLNVSAYKQAWQAIIKRHAILRTVFSWKNRKEPLQIVLKQVDIPWTEEDWRHLSEAEQQEALDAYLVADEKKGFELNKPLLRFKLIRLADDAYRFVWSHHHILFDGWSFSIILTDAVTAYHLLNNGQPLTFPSAPPYRDYIAWLQKQDEAAATQFWQENLRGLADLTPVVPETPAHKRQTRYETSQLYHVQFSPETTTQLQAFAQTHHVTVNTLFQAAWAIVLSRYNRTADVIFGATVSGRPAALPDVESMVGLFINTLPLRVHVDEEAELLPWLHQLQDHHIQLEQYAHTPLPAIQRCSDIPPDKHLFDNLVVFENYPFDESLQTQNAAQGLQASQIETTIRVNYPLVLVVIPQAAIKLSVGYAPEYISQDEVKSLLRHLQTLLGNIIQHPHQKISAVSLLNETESAHILTGWNDTTADYPIDHQVHQLFEQVAEQSPEAIALKYEGQELTYHQLNSQANQLAHYLRQQGVGPEVFVALSLERSTEMIITILAILKAGGIYAPIDVTYPPERLTFILQDTQAPILITRQALVKEIDLPDIHLITLDTLADTLDQYPIHNLAHPHAPMDSRQLAYVMYTSGSTGQPKGSLIQHRSITRLILNTNYVHFRPTDTVVHGSNTSFDAATFEIWGALLRGGRLLILPTETLLSPDALATCLQAEEVDVLFVTPALFNRLMAERPNTFGAVRDLVLGGEALAIRWIRECFAAEPHPECIVNGYGPTENTTFTTCHRMESVPEENIPSIPIGIPIANTQVYVLDDYLRPVPAGVLGELYAGGDGVARGYLNRFRLTAERFIPNPFSQRPGERLYCTGDLVRYLPDGTIEFHGRADRQVKIRGFRIEPGEVEEAIAPLENVKDVVVITQPDPSGNKALVAYIVPQEPPFALNALKAALADKLPAYMLPAAFVVLEGLPMTPNGKVDHRMLPKPTVWGQDAVDNFVAPRSQLESALAHIWQTVLERESVGVKDNFFEIGGHSLLAVHLMSQIRQHFEKELPLAVLFEFPTIEHLAKLLDDEGEAGAWSSAVMIQAEEPGSPFFCVSGAGGNVLYFYPLAQQVKRPFYGLQAKGLAPNQEPHTRIEEMAAYYIEAIQTIQPQGPYYLGGHSFGSWVAFEMARQLIQARHEVALLAVLDTPAPSTSHIFRDIHLSHTERLIRICRLVERWAGHSLAVPYDTLPILPPDEQLSRVADALIQSDMMPPGTQRDEVLRLIKVFQANDEAMNFYTPPCQSIPCQIALFQAAESSEEDLAQEAIEQTDDTWDWRKFTSSEVIVAQVPGDHITMLVEPQVSELAARLNQAMLAQVLT